MQARLLCTYSVVSPLCICLSFSPCLSCFLPASVRSTEYVRCPSSNRPHPSLCSCTCGYGYIYSPSLSPLSCLKKGHHNLLRNEEYKRVAPDLISTSGLKNDDANFPHSPSAQVGRYVICRWPPKQDQNVYSCYIDRYTHPIATTPRHTAQIPPS